MLQAVRYYVAYALSFRDIEEIFKERGLGMDHATLQRWVLEYAPQLEKAFRKRKGKVSSSWRMDENYVKIKGVWHYLYRAVDKVGDTIDFYLSETRDEAAATAFLEKSIAQHGLPEKVVIDKSGANAAALIGLNGQIWLSGLVGHLIDITAIKYLNNIVEQSHRPVKRKMKQCMGWKSKDGAEAAIAGVELWQMLRKGQIVDAHSMTLCEQFYALAA
ncbi:transposase [Vibrio vulnificus]|nr:transposase [Vibrio vulnificus]